MQSQAIAAKPTFEDTIVAEYKKEPAKAKKLLSVFFGNTTKTLDDKLQLLIKLRAECKTDHAQTKELLLVFLENPRTSPNDKCRLLAMLLEAGEAKNAAIISAHLPHGPALVALLSKSSLKTGQCYERVIEFAYSQKMLNAKQKESIYFELVQTLHTRNDNQAKVVILLKYLSFSHHKVDTRIYGLYDLGTTYHRLDQYGDMLRCLRDAYNLEQSSGYKIFEIGIVLSLLKENKKGLNEDFNLVDVTFLAAAFSIAPKDDRVIKVIIPLVDEIIKRLGREKIAYRHIQTVYNYLKIIPELSDRIPLFLNKLTELPEDQCSFNDKIFFLMSYQQQDLAIVFAKKTLEANPHHAAALLLLGKKLLEQGKPDEAMQHFYRIIMQREQDSEFLISSYYLLGLSSFDVLNYWMTIYWVERTIELDFSSAPMVLMIKAYFALGEIKQAKQLLAEANLKFPKDQLLDDCHKELFEFKVSSHLLNKSAPTDLLAKEIQYHFNHREFEPAKTKALYILEKNPNHLRAHQILAKIYIIEKNFPQALNHLEMMKKNCHSGSLADDLMKVYFYTNQLEKATEQAWIVLNGTKFSVRTSQQHQLAFSVITEYYSASSLYESGIQRLLSILKEMERPPIEQSYIHFNIANLYFSAEKFKEAEEHAIKAVQLCSAENVTKEMHLLLGKACYFNNNYALAISSLKKCLKLQSVNTDALLYLGHAHYDQEGDARVEALNYYAQALALDPSLFTELANAMPPDVFKKFRQDLASPPPAPLVTHSPTTAAAPMTSVEKVSALPLAALETKSAPVRLTRAQIYHRLQQTRKERIKFALQEKERETDDKKSETRWHIPGTGFVSTQHPRVYQVFFVKNSRTNSHVRSYLDRETLKKECSEELLQQMDTLLASGKAACKKGDQGIRFLNKTETAHTAEIVGEGYEVKLKGLGSCGKGNIRLFGRYIPSETDPREKLLCFDRVVFDH